MESVPLFTIQGPLMKLPPVGAIRAEHFLRGFKLLVRTLGGDYRKILEFHDIDPAACEDPDYPLSCNAGAAILDYCSVMLDDRMFGLRLADHQDPDVYGCLSVFARAAPTLRHAIDSMVEYLPVLHCPGADVEAVSSETIAEFRWRPYGNIGTDEQSIAHGVLLFVKFIESFAGRDFRPAYVNAVTDLTRKEIEFMEKRFRCKVNARSNATAIGIAPIYLDRPLDTSNKVIRGLVGSYLAQMKRSQTSCLIEEVEAFVALELASGKCSLERCADKLDVAVRTLHRHLTRQGTSFSEIVDKQRAELAKKLLQDKRYSLDEVASMLGYSEQSSFNRAFKRWTSLTPKTYYRFD